MKYLIRCLVFSKDVENVESWVELPDSDLDPGVLPVEIRKLVERRREVRIS